MWLSPSILTIASSGSLPQNVYGRITLKVILSILSVCKSLLEYTLLEHTAKNRQIGENKNLKRNFEKASSISTFKLLCQTRNSSSTVGNQRFKRICHSVIFRSIDERCSSGFQSLKFRPLQLLVADRNALDWKLFGSSGPKVLAWKF